MLQNDFKLASIIKKGFTHHKELNPQLFDESQTLRKEVRDKLLVIADDFIDSLNINHIDFEDIVIVGSIVNYNWNPYSDVDLHVTFNFDDIDADSDLVTEFFLAKKSEWNQEHDIKIYTYDVELYGQNANEDIASGGIYSVVKNEWIRKPEPEDYKISEESLIKKTKHFMRLVDDVLQLDGSDQSKVKKLKAIKDKIKKYRKSGLENGGEYSEENLVFKMLRRTGYLEKLSNTKHELEDKIMSLPEGLNLVKSIVNTPEDWFKKLLNQMRQATKPEHPNSIFFHINGEIYMEINYNSENGNYGRLWVNYDKIWSIFESRFGLNYNQIKDLIKGMVEAHTSLRGLTPYCV